MNRSSLLVVTVGILAATFAFALIAQPESPPRTSDKNTVAVAAIADRNLGLSKVSVFDVPSPPPVADNESRPGKKPALPRAYPEAPPRIPHRISGRWIITRDDNSCVDCHLIDVKSDGDPTPIPGSHKIDLRNAPGKAGEKVVGARWFCNACHVPVTDAAPLVGNEFTASPGGQAEP